MYRAGRGKPSVFPRPGKNRSRNRARGDHPRFAASLQSRNFAARAISFVCAHAGAFFLYTERLDGGQKLDAGPTNKFLLCVLCLLFAFSLWGKKTIRPGYLFFAHPVYVAQVFLCCFFVGSISPAHFLGSYFSVPPCMFVYRVPLAMQQKTFRRKKKANLPFFSGRPCIIHV